MGWLKDKVSTLTAAGIRVSLFVDPDQAQIFAASLVLAPVIEIHTGAWCDALAAGDRDRAAAEWERIREAARVARVFGLEVHAGHGLTYASAETIAALAEIVELNIGHFLVGEAVYGGLAAAVKAMRAAMDRGRARAGVEP
jgi:pyridoxine 5-phosphate synthase